MGTMGNSIAAIDGSATTFLCAGMSMGAPLASLAGLHLSNLGHTSNGVVTFGPRVGNLKLAEAIVTTITSGVGTVGIAYMRDPVPHLPPRVFGYKSGQGLLFHIAIHSSASVDAALGAGSVAVEDAVRYAASYENTVTNAWQGDKKFTSATYTYKLTDHFGYFLSMDEALMSCGMMSEDFIRNDKATELFFM